MGKPRRTTPWGREARHGAGRAGAPRGRTLPREPPGGWVVAPAGRVPSGSRGSHRRGLPGELACGPRSAHDGTLDLFPNHAEPQFSRPQTEVGCRTRGERSPVRKGHGYAYCRCASAGGLRRSLGQQQALGARLSRPCVTRVGRARGPRGGRAFCHAAITGFK